MEAVIDRQTADDLAKHFAAISEHVSLRPIHSEAEYEAAVNSMNALLDAGGADEKHHLAGLVAALGCLIGDYDDANYPAKAVPPSEMLRFLMDQHGLKQGDLPEIGTQGVVSEVLNGKRDLNIRQVRALSERFSISASAFIDQKRVIELPVASTSRVVVSLSTWSARQVRMGSAHQAVSHTTVQTQTVYANRPVAGADKERFLSVA